MLCCVHFLKKDIKKHSMITKKQKKKKKKGTLVMSTEMKDQTHQVKEICLPDKQNLDLSRKTSVRNREYHQTITSFNRRPNHNI